MAAAIRQQLTNSLAISAKGGTGPPNRAWLNRRTVTVTGRPATAPATTPRICQAPAVPKRPASTSRMARKPTAKVASANASQ